MKYLIDIFPNCMGDWYWSIYHKGSFVLGSGRYRSLSACRRAANRFVSDSGIKATFKQESKP